MKFPLLSGNLVGFELNENEGSWFASLDLFCLMVFAPLGGALSGFIGRKKTMIFFSPIASIGWILIAISKSNMVLFLGRFLSSIALALMLSSPSKIFYT